MIQPVPGQASVLNVTTALPSWACQTKSCPYAPGQNLLACRVRRGAAVRLISPARPCPSDTSTTRESTAPSRRVFIRAVTLERTHRTLAVESRPQRRSTSQHLNSWTLPAGTRSARAFRCSDIIPARARACAGLELVSWLSAHHLSHLLIPPSSLTEKTAKPPYVHPPRAFVFASSARNSRLPEACLPPRVAFHRSSSTRTRLRQITRTPYTQPWLARATAGQRSPAKEPRTERPTAT